MGTQVNHAELLRIAQEAYKRRETLAVQVHTHPGPAFHSWIDNEYPLVREVGALSIVVADYACGPVGDWARCATFRLTHDGWLGPIPIQSLKRLVRVEEETE